MNLNRSFTPRVYVAALIFTLQDKGLTTLSPNSAVVKIPGFAHAPPTLAVLPVAPVDGAEPILIVELRVIDAPPPPTDVICAMYPLVVAASNITEAHSPATTPENGVPAAAVNTLV